MNSGSKRNLRNETGFPSVVRYLEHIEECTGGSVFEAYSMYSKRTWVDRSACGAYAAYQKWKRFVKLLN